MQVHAEFVALTREWVESRHANGINDGNDDPGRKVLCAFIAEQSEEVIYAAVQAAMDSLDQAYLGRNENPSPEEVSDEMWKPIGEREQS